MEGYLGSFPVDVATTSFKDYTQSDWAMYFIEYFGQYDGAHHKQWVLDQVARILKGSPITIDEARWSNGTTEYRVSVGDPSSEYEEWVRDMLGDCDDDGEYEYEYDEGIPP